MKATASKLKWQNGKLVEPHGREPPPPPLPKPKAKLREKTLATCKQYLRTYRAFPLSREILGAASITSGVDCTSIPTHVACRVPFFFAGPTGNLAPIPESSSNGVLYFVVRAEYDSKLGLAMLTSSSYDVSKDVEG